MNEGKIFEEATGIFIGELLEDMIDTVARTKKLYCNVYIPQFYARDFDHPLTYVPLWAMSLPLRKGDKVMVEFHQGDLTLPVLYKNPNEIDKQFYEKFEFGDFVKSSNGGNVDKPEAVDTVGSTRLGVDSYVIKTDDYTVFHQNNGFILIDKEDKIYVYGSEINIVSTGTTNVDSKNDINVFTESNIKVECKKDVTVKTDGKTSLEINSDTSLKVNNNGRLEIETQNGDVSIKVGGMSKLNAETSNGDVSIKANGTGKINAETQSGDITVKANGMGKVNVETQMGDVSVKAGGTGGVKITSGAGGVSINNHLRVTM